MERSKLYTQRKIQLSNELSKFISDDDLTHLANMILLGRLILKQNHFPFKNYKEYLRKTSSTL